MESENTNYQSLLGPLEHVSSAASGSDLSFRKVIESVPDAEAIASFLGITSVQAVFFSCFTELSLQRAVTLEALSKHLRCSVLRLINCMNDFDRAFERRFTFKIEFPKPEAGVRKRIWLSRLPELSDEEASKLGEQFGITGGEIEVQVRQALLSKVLNRKISLYDTLAASCSKDHGFTGRKRVGF